jgi:TetR/AcrR family transcriptional repressor of nem operon
MALLAKRTLTTMARPQEYDRAQALDKVLGLFWSQGYNATNLPQLLACTGLSRSSFYNAFGDKRQAFIESLARYSNGIEARLQRVRKAASPAAAVYAYYEPIFDPKRANLMTNGCLLVNTLLEFEDVDLELYSLAKQQTQRIDETFLECFERALAANQLSIQIPAHTLTNLFTAVHSGIQVKRRAGADFSELRALIDGFLLSIGAIDQLPEGRNIQ